MIVNLIKGKYFFTAESKKDFSGWEIVGVEDFKLGVKRIHIRRDRGAGKVEFRMVFCEDKDVPTQFKRICA